MRLLTGVAGETQRLMPLKQHDDYKQITESACRDCLAEAFAEYSTERIVATRRYERENSG